MVLVNNTMEYEQKFYTKWWFWLFIISVIVFIIFAIIYESNDKGIYTSNWIWAIGVIGLILFIISIFMYLNDVLSYKRLMKCLNKPEIKEIDKPVLFNSSKVKPKLRTLTRI